MTSHESTVLIPTFERADLLAQAVERLALFDRSRTRFIILDGSINAAQDNRRLCESSGVEYHHYAADVHVVERLESGLRMVETPFASILADDDVLNPRAYHECVAFLSQNPNYSLAHGRYLEFSQTATTPGYPQRSHEHNSPLDRLFDFLSDYQPNFYGVYRTGILRACFDEVLHHKLENDNHLTELLAALIPVAAGRVKWIDHFYYGRQVGQSLARESLPMPMLAARDNFFEQHRLVRNIVLRHLGPGVDANVDTELAMDMCLFSYYSKFNFNWNTILHCYREHAGNDYQSPAQAYPYPYLPPPPTNSHPQSYVSRISLLARIRRKAARLIWAGDSPATPPASPNLPHIMALIEPADRTSGALQRDPD